MPLRPPRVLKHSGTRPSWPCSAHPNVDMSPCSVRNAMWSLPEGIGGGGGGRGRGREGGEGRKERGGRGKGRREKQRERGSCYCTWKKTHLVGPDKLYNPSLNSTVSSILALISREHA